MSRNFIKRFALLVPNLSFVNRLTKLRFITVLSVRNGCCTDLMIEGGILAACGARWVRRMVGWISGLATRWMVCRMVPRGARVVFCVAGLWIRSVVGSVAGGMRVAGSMGRPGGAVYMLPLCWLCNWALGCGVARRCTRWGWWGCWMLWGSRPNFFRCSAPMWLVKAAPHLCNAVVRLSTKR